MQDVKLFLLVYIVFICTSCNRSNDRDFRLNDNKGGYTVEFQSSKNNERDSLVVKGNVYDQDSKKPLAATFINFYCEKVQTDATGFYQFKIHLNLDVEYFFRAISIGYKTVNTEIIPLIKSDTLIIDFYLDKDETPIFHCN